MQAQLLASLNPQAVRSTRGGEPPAEPPAESPAESPGAPPAGAEKPRK
jgi:hypothetical protein